MQAKELQAQVSASLQWFLALVLGSLALVWALLTNWPGSPEICWLARAIVLAAHLLIWRNAVGRLYEVNLTGHYPRWLTAIHGLWFGLLLLFQAGCIFCLPILDILNSFGMTDRM